jgi:glycine cleavage system aminomethyltransferase T
VRDAVALFDQSSFTKFLVTGRDALAVLNRVSANEIDVPVGRVVYTQWLNERGGIEADLTVTRTGETEFLVVTTAAGQTRDMAWLKAHIPDGARCTALDITSGLPMLGLMGPQQPGAARGAERRDLSTTRVPLRHLARARDRLCAGAGQPHHLCGRARLRALHPGRVRRPRVRCAA